MGEEGVGRGIPKVAGSRGNKGNFAIEKCKEAGANKYRAGTAVEACGKREA